MHARFRGDVTDEENPCACVKCKHSCCVHCLDETLPIKLLHELATKSVLLALVFGYALAFAIYPWVYIYCVDHGHMLTFAEQFPRMSLRVHEVKSICCVHCLDEIPIKLLRELATKRVLPALIFGYPVAFAIYP